MKKNEIETTGLELRTNQSYFFTKEARKAVSAKKAMPLTKEIKVAGAEVCKKTHEVVAHNWMDSLGSN